MSYQAKRDEPVTYEIEFYEDNDGYSEIDDFLHHLDESNQKFDKALLKKIIHQMNMLEMLGPKLNEPQSKFLKGYRHPIMELRPMPERIFYAAWQNDKFVLLHHYTKKQNKTDPKELEKALKKLDDWYERKGR
jgi:phage-related protein